MPQQTSFLKGIFQYSISTWANLFLGIISVVITTRLLSPDVYGLISIFISASSVMLYVLTLGLDGAYIRFYNEPPGNDTKTQLLYKNILFSTITCLAVGLCVFVFWGDTFSERIFGIASRAITGLLFVFTFCQIILRYLNISFRMSFRVKQYNIQNILINSLSKFLIILAAFITEGFVWIVSILTIGIFSILIVYFYKQRQEYIPYNSNNGLDLSVSVNHYGDYIRFALFSAPSYIVVYLNTYINQQLILSNMTAYALGIFSSTVLFGNILSAVKGGFSTFWSAYVYQSYRDDSKRIGMMHDYVVAFTIIAVSGLICFRDVIYLFIGENYHSSKLFFSLLLTMPVFSFLLETTDKGIALAKKNHISLLIHLFSVLLNVVLCIILIPKFQLMGAAWANVISALFLYVGSTFYGQKYYKTILNMWKSLIGTLILLFIIIVPSFIYDIAQLVIAILIIDIIAFCYYRTEYKTICSKIVGIADKVFNKH